MRADLARLLNRDVTAIERIGGGFNSQVYRVDTDGGERLVLKVYFRHAGDQRDRLATEYDSFSWLWQNGFREIPRPVLRDPGPGWAVYQFIEGEKIPRGRVGDQELAVAADFLARLRTLSRDERSRRLGAASEACFAATQIVDNVRRRLGRLEAVEGISTAHPDLRRFLDEEFKPFLESVTRWSEARLKADGMAFDAELDWSRRTLSPSDFGFHNALRQPDGRIIFLDFEYFGWDDPAKMISDFLLHPAMSLSPDSMKKFASALFRRFSDWPQLPGRVQGVYPLFGLKWCLIMLNEFLPDQLLRRQFAATAATDRFALQRQQLDKARQMLDRIRREYERFPIHD